jgi:hypothetical protein
MNKLLNLRPTKSMCRESTMSACTEESQVSNRDLEPMARNLNRIGAIQSSVADRLN